ncbi:hypothetical protein ACFVZ3_12775, partial [Kitasatospora purpeofusca]|uniref:hypothetical protein n=1 Tax=Kitasatospora purpeofusca TaxID=67352 RepID=UPI0036892768
GGGGGAGGREWAAHCAAAVGAPPAPPPPPPPPPPRLRVLPRVDPLFGLPPRLRRPPAVRLRPGEWVRWQLHHRFSSAAGTQDWSYWLDTYNIAYGPVDAEVFLSEPTVFVDECGPLR